MNNQNQLQINKEYEQEEKIKKSSKGRVRRPKKSNKPVEVETIVQPSGLTKVIIPRKKK